MARMKHETPIIALILALALSLMLVSPAQAFLEPPARFDFEYPGGTSVFYYPQSEMRARCSTLAQRQLPREPAECGVARIWKKTMKRHCFVFISERYEGTETADLLRRHGQAHCNGWSHPYRRP